MSLKNNAFRFAACMAATLLLGALAVPAAAESDNSASSSATDSDITLEADEDDLNTVVLSKTVTAVATTYMPNTSFVFNVASGPAGTLDGQPVLAGPADGALFAGSTQGSVVFTPDDGLGTQTKTLPLSIDLTKFSAVGIYHYLVSETAGTYEGITYDTAVRDMYVYIVNGPEDTRVLGAAALYVGEEKTSIFTNDYGLHNGTLHNLSVTKTITGNQAVLTREFHFTLRVDGAEGEKYLVTTGTGTETSVVSGASLELPLKNNETFTVYGLSASDSYTVTETEANTEGYVTTFDGVTTGSVTGTISADKTIACVNHRDASLPTGLHTDALPYAAMLLLAGGCAVMLLRKKSR